MIQTNNNIPIYQQDSPFDRQWSIRQANSRLHAFGQDALEQDLSRQVRDEPIAMSLHESNPYLSSTPMTQQPSKPVHRGPKHKVYGFQDPFAAAPMEAWQEIKDYNLRVNGLPTLEQMMRLNTYSPLTQSNFSMFLKRHGVQHHLTLLMELEAHDKLWRAYLQSMDRQNRQQLSQFLESAAEDHSVVSFAETPDTDDLLSPLPIETASKGQLSHDDLVQNATRIYRTYCDGTQLIHLPKDHRQALQELVEVHQRPEPVVFDATRVHVFEILDVFYYPMFVDDVLNKNISLMTSRLFLVVGFIVMVLACSVELSLIFLDTGGRHSRWIPIAPFFVGWSFLLSSITEFAWWFGITSISESQFMVYLEIQDVTVKHIHRKHGWLWLALIMFLSIISTLIFAFIPSHRL